MFESEHRYFCIGKYLGRGGGNGWEWGYCTQGHTLQAIKTASGSRNKAARVEMLALFQNEIGYSHGQIATSCVPSPFSNVNQTTLQHCLPHYEENIVPVIGASFVSISVFSFRFPFPVSIFHFQFPFYFHFLLFHMPGCHSSVTVLMVNTTQIIETPRNPFPMGRGCIYLRSPVKFVKSS